MVGTVTAGSLAGCLSSGDDTDDGEDGSGEPGPGSSNPADGDSGDSEDESSGPADGSDTEPETTVTELWRADIRGTTAPVVAEDTVYVGADNGNLYAIDVSDGSERWQFETGQEIQSTPAVADGTVYFGSNDGYVYAVNAADGSEAWQYEAFDQVASSPVVRNDTVYIGSGIPSFIEGRVHALDRTDGSENWVFNPDSSVPTRPVVRNGTVYIGAGEVYAIDAAEGTKEWEFSPINVGGNMALTMANGTVYCTHGTVGEISAVDASDGTKQWTFGTTGSLENASDITEEFSRPTVADGTVYLGSQNTESNSNRDANVYAIDAANGTEQWTVAANGAVRASPVVAGNTVYIGTTRNTLYALNASTGATEWTFETGRVSTAVAVRDSTIYANSFNLFALTEQ